MIHAPVSLTQVFHAVGLPQHGSVHTYCGRIPLARQFSAADAVRQEVVVQVCCWLALSMLADSRRPTLNFRIPFREVAKLRAQVCACCSSHHTGTLISSTLQLAEHEKAIPAVQDSACLEIAFKE